MQNVEHEIAYALADAGVMPLKHYLQLCKDNEWVNEDDHNQPTAKSNSEAALSGTTQPT